MCRILVLGGTTFVGSAMAQYLIGKGYKVDVLTRGLKPLNYGGVSEHLIGDRRIEEDMHRVLAGREYDYIFDISAYTREDVRILLSSIPLKTIKKYILCSSGAVYQPSNQLITEEDPRGENHHWGKYGLDKKEAEDYLFKLYHETGFPVIIFRSTYIYGQNNNLYREAYFFERISTGKKIPIPDGQGTLIQFIHIDDLVRIFASALANNHIGKAYNVTYPETVSWEDLVKCCGKIANRNVCIHKVNVNLISAKVREFFPFRDVHYTLDIANLVRDGFYIPKVNLEKGLQKTYNWYIEEKPNLHDSRMSMVEEIICKEQ